MGGDGMTPTGYWILGGVLVLTLITLAFDIYRIYTNEHPANTHEDRRRQETDADRLARWVEADARRRSGMAPPLGTSQAKGFKGEQPIHANVSQFRRAK
jgi:hypothetical protein